MDNLVIKKVEKNNPIVKDLLIFINNFSWEDGKDHIFWMVNDWVFTEWETMFVALVNDKIAGIASIMKTDYYPLFNIYPWVSTIFVSEEYRGNRISESLINYANNYAKELGFKRTYIPSPVMGLYEKYGYTYLKDMTNYGGGKGHIYYKEI